MEVLEKKKKGLRPGSKHTAAAAAAVEISNSNSSKKPRKGKSIKIVPSNLQDLGSDLEQSESEKDIENIISVRGSGNETERSISESDGDDHIDNGGNCDGDARGNAGDNSGKLSYIIS